MSQSSAPKLLIAAPLEPVEIPRAKPLRVLTTSVAIEAAARRTALSNRRAALKVLQLRLATELTQVDAAAQAGGISSRTVGRYETASVDLGPLRYYLDLLDFHEEQLKKGGR